MIGSVARVPPNVPSGRLTQDTVKLDFREPDREISNFIYWILRTTHYRAYCAGRAMGSAVVALSRDDFLSYPVPSATPDRKQAVKLLEAIDEKIELTRQTNETLEALAQTIFKSWFVDATATKLPKGCRESTIGEEVRVIGGSTPSTTKPEFWEDGTHHWATPKDLAPLDSPVLLNTERKITELGLEQIGSGLLPVGTVLLSSRAPIGYMAIAEVPVAVNQGFIAMICNGSLPNHFVRLWTKQNMEAIKGRANGTTFMEISKSNFRTLPVLVPPQTLLDEFQQQIEPLHRRVVSNLEESQTLAELRDALLPKLLSGELRVPAKLKEAVA
jgi:type I restriction enzyme S subunit